MEKKPRPRSQPFLPPPTEDKPWGRKGGKAESRSLKKENGRLVDLIFDVVFFSEISAQMKKGKKKREAEGSKVYKRGEKKREEMGYLLSITYNRITPSVIWPSKEREKGKKERRENDCPWQLTERSSPFWKGRRKIKELCGKG